VEIREIAQRPTLLEMQERLNKREPVFAKFDSARLVREVRDAR